jgi:hypothetical protein
VIAIAAFIVHRVREVRAEGPQGIHHREFELEQQGYAGRDADAGTSGRHGRQPTPRSPMS